MSSSNNDDFSNAFGNSAGAFPPDSSTDDTGEPDFDSMFGVSDADPFAAQSQPDAPFAAQEQQGVDAADSSSLSSDLPFGDWSASADMPLPDGVSDPASDFSAAAPLSGDAPLGAVDPLSTGESVAAPPAGKKGKKGGKAKAKRVKEPARRIPWSFADVLLLLYGVLAFVSVVAIDAAVFMKFQMTAMNFFIAFNVLALFFLLVPLMLFRQSRRGEQPNFYDVILGLSLTLVILAAIVVLFVQSLKYGMNFKADLKGLPSVPVSSAPAAPAATPAAPVATPAAPAATPAAPAAKPAAPAATPAAPAATPAAPAATPAAPAATPAAPAAKPASPAAKPATPAATPATPAATPATPAAKPATPAATQPKP
ncbi:MAG: hypothetical protein PHQ75_12685 [Thermoguttaceae bacterium]|nr:hypothetical protein [Thermoguttaceae bacterium]